MFAYVFLSMSCFLTIRSVVCTCVFFLLNQFNSDYFGILNKVGSVLNSRSDICIFGNFWPLLI